MICTCIRDPRDVRRVAVQDPHCPTHHSNPATDGQPHSRTSAEITTT